MEDRNYMELALRQAEEAAAAGEVPVGCVIVRNGEVLAAGRNRREETGDATAHAEMEALRAASRALGRWHLEDCTLYVTLEPCPMCAGAIWNARLGRVVYAAADERFGCCGSLLHFGLEGFAPWPEVTAGVGAGASAALLGRFFRGLRKKDSI